MSYWERDLDYELYDEGDADEGYTGRPIPEADGPRGAEVHHINCPWQEGETYGNCECRQLWEEDYQNMRDKEAEDLHQEYWG